jgi:hypothetical protein
MSQAKSDLLSQGLSPAPTAGGEYAGLALAPGAAMVVRRFMTIKTISRLLLAMLLLGGYYVGPRFLDGRGGAGPGFTPGAVVRIDIRDQSGEWTRLRKRGHGDWTVDGRQGVQADPGVVGRLLSRLQTAQFTPEPAYSPSGDEVQVVFHGRWSTLQRIDLGPRLEPFHRQIVFIDGRSYAVDADLGAILGVWHEQPEMWLESRVPLSFEGEEIVTLRWENPFGTYEFEKGTQVVRRYQDEGRTVELYGWKEKGTHSEAVPSAAVLQLIVEALAVVPADRLATAEEVLTPPEVYSRVSIGTRKGREVVAVVSASKQGADHQFLKVLEPVESEWWVVRGAVANRVSPAGAVLFDPRPGYRTVANRARRVTYEREGRRVVLERGTGTAWRMSQPRVPMEIYRPPPDPDTPRPLTTAETYLQTLEALWLEEPFVIDTEARRALIAGVFAAPLARILIEAGEAQRTEILISHPVGSTERVFLSVNGEVGVIGQRAAAAFAPDVGHFFDPQAFSGAMVEW